MTTQPRYPEIKAAAAAVGNTLSSAKIPNMLWSWTALALFIVDHGFPEIEFLIQDNEVPQATGALTKAGYKNCTDPSCSELQEDRGAHLGDALNRFHPVAAAHFHLPPPNGQGSGYLVSLLKKNDIIPHLPDLKLGLPKQKEYELLTLSIDPRLPPRAEGGASGPWYDLPFVRVPQDYTLAQALLLLRCRHVDTNPGLDGLWRDMLWEIRRFKQPHPFEFGEKHFSPLLGQLWGDLVQGNPNYPPDVDLQHKLRGVELVREARDRMPRMSPDGKVLKAKKAAEHVYMTGDGRSGKVYYAKG
ncbi:uncharacterized protein DSM5745_05722 [Aspergillus mulundensis]|uniref:Uncharacterized protein n=1 Tax=Aspergillus mulundensis TaxID=1810919 RepID=A0A3D8RYD2_9EURO|nr:hypothetical protein DSM5745_05722 [Aspergillus mulundensis]RDW78870.1 hypothetical protein DSM5745_05722 [Aspergillus mulundensis]